MGLSRGWSVRGRYGRRIEARSVGRKLGVASFLVLLEVTAVLLLGGTGGIG